MTNKEKIKNILIEEFSKINNVNYRFEFQNLTIKIKIKKLIPSLVNQCDFFVAGIDSEWRFDLKKNSSIWFSYKHIWSKFEKEIGLKYPELQSLVKDVLDEGFILKEVTPRKGFSPGQKGLDEGFILKGVVAETSY